MGGWDKNVSYEDWLWVCGVDAVGSGWGPLTGCCKHDDEPSGSDATELVSSLVSQSSQPASQSFSQSVS
jgi:hypothetical protein